MRKVRTRHKESDSIQFTFKCELTAEIAVRYMLSYLQMSNIYRDNCVIEINKEKCNIYMHCTGRDNDCPNIGDFDIVGGGGVAIPSAPSRLVHLTYHIP